MKMLSLCRNTHSTLASGFALWPMAKAVRRAADRRLASLAKPPLLLQLLVRLNG
jgi:hypothetical protein